MSRLLESNFRFYDSRSVPPLSVVTEMSFFTGDSENTSERVTRLFEKETIKWLLNPMFRDFIVGELTDYQPAFVTDLVEEPIIKKGQGQPGDIDLLICPNNNPSAAIAIQAKRIIVKALNPKQDDDPQKLKEIRKVVNQANLQAQKFAFHRNYLALLVQVDGLNRGESAIPFCGPNPETLTTIVNFPYREKVIDDVGIIIIQICQPSRMSIDHRGLVALGIDQQAKPLVQPESLTNRIKELMRNQGAIE